MFSKGRITSKRPRTLEARGKMRQEAENIEVKADNPYVAVGWLVLFPSCKDNAYFPDS